MKERPVIFNSEMVRALLDGRKTQTRRAVSDRHLHLIDVASQVGECYPLESGIGHENSQSYYREHCPFGKPGDRLWVRESYQVSKKHDAVKPRDLDYERGLSTYYAAGGSRCRDEVGGPYVNHDTICVPGWVGKMRPSIHMPRAACRILLEITAVRVERLNDVSQEDAQAEGMEFTGWRPTYSDPDSGGECMTPYDNFAELWDSIYQNWNANPWVWVIEFKRVEVRDASK